jgi:mannosyltransferase OCH1-like enzyme
MIRGDVETGAAEDATDAVEPNHLIPDRRWTYSHRPVPLPPFAQRIHDAWKAAEPSLQHRVIRDDSCTAALQKYFKDVASNAASWNVATRAFLCGLVAVWHDGGYYVHERVQPGKQPLKEWLLPRVKGHPRVVLHDQHPHTAATWFFGAVPHDVCVAKAIERLGALLRDEHVGNAGQPPMPAINSGPFAALSGVDPRATMALVDGTCGEQALRLHREVLERELLEPMRELWPFGHGDDHRSAALIIAVGGASEVASVLAPGAEVPANGEFHGGIGFADPMRRWIVEDMLRSTVVHEAACRSLALGEFEHVLIGWAELQLAQRRTICGLLALHNHGGIVLLPHYVWLRPLNTWLPQENELLLIAGTSDNSTFPHFAASPRHHPCVRDVLRSIVHDVVRLRRLSNDTASGGVEFTTLAAWIASGEHVFNATQHCARLLPAELVSKGDGFAQLS